MTRKLSGFHGGLHLPAHKTESTALPVARAPLPRRLYLPLQQHIGAPAEPVVKVGDTVLKGQVIAQAAGYVSVPVHAPSSGTVVALAELPIPHPSGLLAPTIVIETDGRETWVERQPITDYTRLHLSELRNRIRAAGIVGLGGAAFPSFIKLNPGPDRSVDTLILNGAECEPYITCDDMLMRERPEEIIAGAYIMLHAVQARRGLIGVEDNKPAAIAALRAAAGASTRIEIVPVATIYPTGGEKQLIQVLTGREVPSHRLPADMGVVCHNVATAAAVHRAVHLGEPLISRFVTVTGAGVAQPRNLEVLIGTPLRELIDVCGGYRGAVARLVIGGPLMGFAVNTDAAPVIKAANCILVATTADSPPAPPAMPCIRCGRCIEACPASLLPQDLYRHARARRFDRAQDYNLFDCIECGCCAYVCPSHIPLVQYYRFAKTEIWARERERQKADLARTRAEHRRERLEREKQERAARHAAKKDALRHGAPAAGAPAVAIAEKPETVASARLREAIARTETPGGPPAVDAQLVEEQKAIVAAAKARAQTRQP